MYVKESAHSKNGNFYFLAPTQRNQMERILVSYEAPFRSNLQKERPRGKEREREGEGNKREKERDRQGNCPGELHIVL